MPHWAWAYSAQSVSHSTRQQNVSCVQVISQQIRSLQPADGCGLKHDAGFTPQGHARLVQMTLERETQTVSQLLVQQKGSRAHTCSQQSWSLQ